ncbi:MAG: hypothetical protein JO244_09640 [Solirubrobacterales bacterium]|nr:hypothetical protein [Solirubrobacterales bacterium]
MDLRAGRIVTMLLVVLGGPLTGSALATGPVGADPSSNFPVGTMPGACQTAPTGTACIDAAVTYLDQARASLGQPPYSLPSDFVSLGPTQQALILTNEDRILYSLPPITGLTAALDQDAATGVTSDSDPQPSGSDWYGYTSNVSWGDVNMVAAYEGWMYDDGPGSGNVDCTSSDPGGCWGHRHDILWQFGPGALAMGAASGTDSSGSPSYTMLLLQGKPSYNPTYSYTWSQAVADGAGNSGGVSEGGGGSGISSSGSGPSGPGPAAPAVARGARAGIRIRWIRVRGHRVTLRLSGPSPASLRCSLSRVHHRFRRIRRCAQVVSFSHVPAGRYRLRISSGALTVTRSFAVA